MYTRLRMHACMHEWVSAYAHAHACICTRMCTHMRAAYAHAIFIRMHACMLILRLRICVHAHTCMLIRVRTCMHAGTHAAHMHAYWPMRRRMHECVRMRTNAYECARMLLVRI